MHSPGVLHPGGLRGAAEADQGQGNLASTMKQKKDNFFFLKKKYLLLVLLKPACLPTGEAVKGDKEFPPGSVI